MFQKFSTKLKLILTLLIFLTSSISLADGGGGMIAAATLLWSHVEQCVQHAEFDDQVDVTELKKEYGEDFSRLYPRESLGKLKSLLEKLRDKSEDES